VIAHASVLSIPNIWKLLGRSAKARLLRETGGGGCAGALRMIEIGKRAEGKLSLDVGFQIRDCPPFVELGAADPWRRAGEKLFAARAHYFSGYIDPGRPGRTLRAVERPPSHWVYDRALSGDILVEQNIHVIDICNWVLKAHPLKASASGPDGRGRPQDGDVYGNYNVLLHYPEEWTSPSVPHRLPKAGGEVDGALFGTKGTSQVSVYRAAGDLGRGTRGRRRDRRRKTRAGSVFRDREVHLDLEFADREKKKAFVESIASG